ncbi:C40 family peptidase [Mucilaginibacter sp. PAMB04274]|uniref:C40 family peptidase n=1 Tax=Mucilaginibacter sp. PAMB04274 TaxID=3138568 RepID=UPI0031F6725C
MTLNFKCVIALLLLITLSDTQGSAQGLFGKLTQKAKQIGERVLDKAVDDALKGKKQPETKSPTTSTGGENGPSEPDNTAIRDTPAPLVNDMITTDTLITNTDTVYHFNTSTLTPKDFVAYALTLKGTPYVYGSTNPAYGLDCSGFITHVFNHFNIQVPRRTFDFKNAEKKVSITEARPGDILLFTGADASSRLPGHMGIITAKGKDIQFVHASSGQANGVTTSMLSYDYFKSRLVAVVRVF